MGEGLNRVMLLGSVGADPELKMTQAGQAVLNIRLATTERYQDKGGEWQDRTEWHTAVVWGKRAESLHKILEKGSQIFVEGSLRTTHYEDRDGNKRYKTSVSATRVLLCGKGSRHHDSNDATPTRAPSEGTRRAAAAPEPIDTMAPPVQDDSDDLPF